MIVSASVFGMQFLAGGDPAALAAGEGADRQTIDAMRHELGLDRPVYVQYLDWLGRALRGDLGRSFLRHRMPVGEAISGRLPVTIELTLLAIVVSLAIAIPLGVMAALRRNSPVDVGCTILAITGISLPSFFLGILLILFLSVLLRWLPSSGFVPFPADPLGNLRHMLMPAVTLGTSMAAVTMRMMRSSLLEVTTQDYIRTARSKGLAERAVILRHALKNASLPVVTVVGLQVGHLLGGAVVVETVFALPGIGKLGIDSILLRDFPTVQGVVLFMATGFVVVNLLVDLLYSGLDPRIRLK